MNRMAMIADIAGSRQLADRYRVQVELQQTLNALNASNPHLIAPYTITLGDEFQALFQRSDTVFQDILVIMTALHPVQCRFALGIGPITTPINSQEAIGMDGPAFHKARDILGTMKEQDELIAVSCPGSDEALFTGALKLLTHNIRKWQPNRLKILSLLMQQYRVAGIASELGLSEQAVYKNIRMGELGAVRQILQGVTDRINQSLE